MAQDVTKTAYTESVPLLTAAFSGDMTHYHLQLGKMKPLLDAKEAPQGDWYAWMWGRILQAACICKDSNTARHALKKMRDYFESREILTRQVKPGLISISDLWAIGYYAAYVDKADYTSYQPVITQLDQYFKADQDASSKQWAYVMALFAAACQDDINSYQTIKTAMLALAKEQGVQANDLLSAIKATVGTKDFIDWALVIVFLCAQKFNDHTDLQESHGSSIRSIQSKSSEALSDDAKLAIALAQCDEPFAPLPKTLAENFFNYLGLDVSTPFYIASVVVLSVIAYFLLPFVTDVVSSVLPSPSFSLK